MTMTAKWRLFLNAAKTMVLPEGHPDAAFLYAGVGDEIPDSAVEKFGLVDGGCSEAVLAAAEEAVDAAAKEAADAAAKEADDAAAKEAADAAAKEADDAAAKEAAASADKEKVAADTKAVSRAKG